MLRILAILTTLAVWAPEPRKEPDSQGAPTLATGAVPETAAASPGRKDEGQDVAKPGLEADALKREAVAVAIQTAEAYPQDALVHALLGSAYYNTGQADEATRHLKKCLEMSPGQAEAYEVLALIAYEKGKPDESARLCQEALKRGPPNPEVLNRWGRSLMDQGDTEGAIRALQQAVRLPRPTSESSYLLGQALLQSGAFAPARESFLRAIELLPDHTQAYFGLYTACLRLGEPEEAERYRERFQKLESIDRQALTDRSARADTLTGVPQVRRIVARTFFGAAQVQNLHGQTARAAELFRRAAWLDAENPTYRAALESIYVKGGKIEEGATVFEQMVAEQPEVSLNHYFLGRIYNRLERFESAERCFQSVRQLAPEWVEGYRSLAELYLRTNRKIDEAQRLARKMVELQPTAPGYYFLSVACLRNQDRTAALTAIRRALALSPEEPRYQQLLQRLQASP